MRHTPFSTQMEALLQDHEEEYYGVSGFWKDVDGPASVDDICFAGRLSVKTHAGEMKTRMFQLADEFLFMLSKNSGMRKKAVPVRWKRVEPFTEDAGESTRFGFRLVRGQHFQDFYVSCGGELERWLDHLSCVSVMTDLENDYQLLEEVGKGSYAKVYKGRSVFTRSLVAVKVIEKDELAKNVRTMQSLISEVGIMKKLQHNRLVQLIARYESESSLYLVLEYVGGGDLFQRLIKMGKYSERKAIMFMRNLLEAVDYMHSKGVVHRDIKPENILLVSGTDGMEFKIADFGLSSEIAPAETLTLRCGSPGYVAPEILEKNPYDAKVDVFSAGIVMYIILSGRSPFAFSSEDANQVLIRNRSCKIMFQQKYWKDVSQLAVDLVLELTEKSPTRRLSAKQALLSPWFSSEVDCISPLHLSSASDRLPSFSPNERIVTSEMMRRLNFPSPQTYNSVLNSYAMLTPSPNREAKNQEDMSVPIRGANAILEDLRSFDSTVPRPQDPDQPFLEYLDSLSLLSENASPGRLLTTHQSPL